MRIGLFTDTYLPDINGVVSSIDLLRKKLEEQGNDVYVICTHPAFLKTTREGNIIRLPGVKIKKLYGYAITQPIHNFVMKEIADLKLDIIHAHTEFGVGIFARLCSRILNIPLVSTYHTAYEDYVHYVNPLGLERVDGLGRKAVATLSKFYMDTSVRVISPSNKTKEMLAKYGVSKEHISVIPTGLDLRRFEPSNTSDSTVDAIHKKIGLKDGYKELIFLGRIAKEKDIDMVIDAVKLVDKKDFKMKFIIVGGGPDEERLKKRIVDENLTDYCLLNGKVPQDEVASYYHSAHVFVSGSTTETQGMTYIEALTSGLPIIVRRDPVVEELVDEGKTGFYFDNAEELSNILVKINQMSFEELSSMKEACVNKTKVYDDVLFGKSVYDFYKLAIDEYSLQYNIDSIKVSGDYVKLHLTNMKNGEDIVTISVDTYYEYGLRKGDHIYDHIYNLLKEEEHLINGYKAVIRKVSRRDYSCFEIRKLLSEPKFELDNYQIDLIIERLKEKRILNDRRFAEGKINSMLYNSSSYKAIERELKEHSIDIDVIKEIYNSMSNEHDELEFAKERAEHYLKVSSGKSAKRLKITIIAKLIKDGFDPDTARKAFNSLDLQTNKTNEMQLLKNKASKAKIRYSRKASGTDLRNKVFTYLANLGFEIEDIYVVIDEMDWE